MECHIPYQSQYDDHLDRDGAGTGVTADPIVHRKPAASMPQANLGRDLIRPGSRAANLDNPVDSDYVICRLEEAGATLLALPGTGWSTRIRTSSIEIVRTALEAYGWDTSRVRPAVPSAEKIDRMDEAMAWIAFIRDNRYVLRRVVGARSLVHPVTDRHLYSWRRLGAALGADHKAVQRWHGQGIAMIVAALHQTE
jgi:hypothetical protein